MKRTYKRIVLIALDTIILILSLFFSYCFLLEYDNGVPLTRFLVSVYVLIGSFLVIAFFTKIYSILSRFTDEGASLRILTTTTLAYLFTFIVNGMLFSSINRRLLFLGYIFSTFLIIASRYSWRYYNNYSSRKSFAPRKRTLVVGAGQGAEYFIRTIRKEVSDIDIIGLVDGDPNKKNTYLLGKKVLGTREDIPNIVKEYEVQEVVIAAPSLPSKVREEIVDICNSINVPLFNMPNVEDVVLGRVRISQLQEIDIADLLGRKEVTMDQEQLEAYFSEKTVLVTGAGGSIGSEICRQVAIHSPKCIILLGHGENSIYLIHRELLEKYADRVEIIPLIADIQDRDLMFEIMKTYQPNVVYHAAAHKHVPLMEYNPREAVKNNIFGTKNVAEATKAANVEKFIMVSTDKAVNPPNVMGATKRVAEMIVTSLNEAGKTQFAAVRFGNVLGSRGSVVPVFKEQIAKGGPVTVTDFRMTRYFMTIPEASRLVVQAGLLASGGEIFVLDMGEPVLIRDLAEKVIKLSGHTVEEIGIIESGIRPGEKLYEELLSSEERVSEQIFDKIFVGKVTSKSQEEIELFIGQLEQFSASKLKQSLIEFAKQE